MSDSGEVARVSTEYAREHLQLAYASTVHGVQGDTADASVVGPDVDAAGLYVGLTRGRLSNVAIAVARTDAAARECLAESMQRGTPKLTMQDAVCAAEAEVRRAARVREAAMATGAVVGPPKAGHGIGISCPSIALKFLCGRGGPASRSCMGRAFQWRPSPGSALTIDIDAEFRFKKCHGEPNSPPWGPDVPYEWIFSVWHGEGSRTIWGSGDGELSTRSLINA